MRQASAGSWIIPDTDHEPIPDEDPAATGTRETTANEEADVSDARLVAQTQTPRTRASLAEDLRKIGLVAGQVIVLHSSLKAIGWVAGGPVAVLLPLQDVLTQY